MLFLFLPKVYPIKECRIMESTTVSTEITILLRREFQKSVTSIASLKLLRLHALGNDKMPLMLFVISEGCLNAMTIVIYSGKMIVERPSIKSTIAVLFGLTAVVVFFITAPPLTRKISSAQQK